MAIQNINVGTTPNDGTGTKWRQAWQWVNQMFSELYSSKSNIENSYAIYQYFNTIETGTSGTVSKPTGGTIIPNWFSGSIAAIVTKADVNGRPIDEPARNAISEIITATLDSNGDYILSSNPAIYPICIVFAFKLKLIDNTQLDWNLVTRSYNIQNSSEIGYKDNSSVKDGLDGLYNIHSKTNEPTGFPNNALGYVDRASSQISYNPSNLTFSLSPTVSSFSYLINGIEYVITIPLTCSFTDQEGWHGFVVDADTNILKEVLVFDEGFIIKNVAVAQGYWDFTNKEFLLGVRDERHGATLDGQAHLWMHDKFSTRLDNGGGLSNFTIGDGSNANHAKFTIDETEIWDEDLKFISAPTSTEIPILHQISAKVWRSNINSGFAFLTAGSGRIAYVNNYTLTESDIGKFIAVHYYATSNINEIGQIFGIQGLAQYDTLSDIIIGITEKLKTQLSRDILPINEECILATVIFESGNFIGGARIVQIQTSNGLLNYIDWKNNVLGYTAENVFNKVSSFSTPPNNVNYPTEKLVKDYIDNLSLGLIWQQPIEGINLTGSTSTWIPENDHDMYLLDIGGATAFNFHGYSFVDGDVVQSQSGIYVFIKHLAIGDSYIAEGVESTTPIGILVGKKNYIAACTNAKPSSFAFTFISPQNNFAVFVENVNCYYNNVSYTYSSSLLQWVQLSASVSLNYGNGLKVTGTTLGLKNLISDWIQTGNFDWSHAGTINKLRLINQSVGFIIGGGITYKTLTVPNNANVSGTNTGDQDLSGLVPKTTSVNGKALSGNISIDKTDVSLGNVSNDAQLKIASNLSDLNNPSTARTNLGLGTLATQNGTFSGASSGTNTGDETVSRLATLNHSANVKVSIVDTDEITGQDSGSLFGLIRTTWASIKAFLKTYFDTLYQVILQSGTNIKTVNTSSLLGAGNLAVGDALVANPLSQFAATTSAQLAGVISDETGSNKLVFSTNPTLIAPILTSTVLDVLPAAGKIEYNGDFYNTIANGLRFATGGVIYTNLTDVSNSGGGGAGTETVLGTYTIPASTLDVNNEYIELDAHISVVGAGNTIIRAYFGTTVIYLQTSANITGDEVRIRAKIYRTGAATQIAVTMVNDSLGTIAPKGEYTTPTETLTNAIVIKVTGQNGTANRVTKRTFEVKLQASV